MCLNKTLIRGYGRIYKKWRKSMGFWSDIIGKSDEEIYEEINRELDENYLAPINKSVWTQAEGLAMGDDKKIRSIYIRLRFQQLKEGK
tara:strand:+ start:210 stop:473 length:264 start_codon:yes stop_codon:yes gene_type:complete